MKHLKAYENITIIKNSNLDKLIDKIKNKFGNDLKKEFSKYLYPEKIQLGKNIVDAFLFKPDFGILINIGFFYSPYKTVANICVVFKSDDKWIRTASYTRYVKHFYTETAGIPEISKIPGPNTGLKEFVEDYVNELKLKYERRKERIFKKDVNKYNI
jgi:hypothetical protein